MSLHSPLERSIAAWMADEAAAARDDEVLDQILTATGGVRPQPRWLVLLLESPMRLNAGVAVGSPTRRIMLVAALALLVLAAAAAVVAGVVRPSPTDDWPGYRGGSGRTTAGITGPAGNPNLRWRFQADGAVNRAVAVAGDVVLTSSDDGALHALAITDGAERWKHDAGTSAVGGPLAVGGRVYLTGGDGVIRALDLATGRLLWQTPATYPGPFDLTFGDDGLYGGTTDGSLIAIDAATGAERWRLAVSPGRQAVHAPAFDDGRVFAAANDAGLLAVDAASGAIAWTAPTEGDATATAVAANGVVYIGASGDALEGHLRAFDQATGGVLWVRDGPIGSPAILDTTGYAQVGTGGVIAIDLASGRDLWSQPIAGVRSPAIAGDMIFVVEDQAERIHALDAATGGELWGFDLDGPVECCIAAVRGLAFVGTASGSLYAVGGDGTAIVPAPIATQQTAVASATAPSPTAGASSSANAPAPPIAEFVWSATAPDAGFVPGAIALAPDGRVWVADVANGRFAIFEADGSFVEFWGATGAGRGEFILRQANGDPFGALAFEADGSFFVLDVGNRRIQSFDADRTFLREWGGFGNEPGRLNNPFAISIGPTGDVTVLDDGREVIETYDRTGRVLDTVTGLPGLRTAIGLTHDGEGNAYVSNWDPPQVRRLSPSGAITGTFDCVGAGVTVVAVDAAGRMYATQGPTQAPGGVRVCSPEGEYLGSWGPPGTADGEMGFPWGIVLDGDGNAYVTDYSGDPAIPAVGRVQRFRMVLPER